MYKKLISLFVFLVALSIGVSAYCTDTDNGMSYTVKGVMTYKPFNGPAQTYTDVCVSASKLVEYYCSAGYRYAIAYNCINGCSDGKCNPTQAQSISVSNILPVLYGQVYDGAIAADGAIVTLYAQKDPSVVLNDIVGIAGNFKLSSYWKLNLNNLKTTLNNGDIIVIDVVNGAKSARAYYTLDLSKGAVRIPTINLG